MVNVDIDKELYEDIKKVIQKKKYFYPSIKFLVQKAVYNELLSSKTYFDSNLDEFYLKLKEILKKDPELRSRIDKIHNFEAKKIRDKERKIFY